MTKCAQQLTTTDTGHQKGRLKEKRVVPSEGRRLVQEQERQCMRKMCGLLSASEGGWLYWDWPPFFFSSSSF